MANPVYDERAASDFENGCRIGISRTPAAIINHPVILQLDDEVDRGNLMSFIAVSVGSSGTFDRVSNSAPRQYRELLVSEDAGVLRGSRSGDGRSDIVMDSPSKAHAGGVEYEEFIGLPPSSYSSELDGAAAGSPGSANIDDGEYQESIGRQRNSYAGGLDASGTGSARSADSGSYRGQYEEFIGLPISSYTDEIGGPTIGLPRNANGVEHQQLVGLSRISYAGELDSAGPGLARSADADSHHAEYEE